ncbi:MAG: glycine cleavage system aminomethyltransferase GcvT [Spirochaetes bacterium]|nr:MAG: glycine cleavage system aminomethyltransferase GcvT [Spirochaetota bacterium]
MLKRTVLYDVYKNYDGVKLIDFGGWELPVNFNAGIIGEHMAVRENAGLFDVSHMGEITVEGETAEAFINWLVTNDVAAMHDNQCMYSPMCYPDGGVVDDLLVYRYSSVKYLLVVNASNIEKDYTWISEENEWIKKSSLKPALENISGRMSQIAFQGPKAVDYMKELVGPEVADIKFFHFRDDLKIGSKTVIISRTGYTGEDGFEIYMANEDAADVWNTLYQSTRDRGVVPCGLGARDTLRFESKLPLYGHELTKDISPLEANLSYFVKLDKDDFCGKDALVSQKENGIPRSLRGCEMIDRGVPRAGYTVHLNGEEIGFVTSGTKSPMLNKFLGLVLVKRGIGLKTGDEIEVAINGKLKKAKLVKTPFYKNT